MAQFNTLRAEGQLNLNAIDADEDSSGGIPYAGDESRLEAIVYDLGEPAKMVREWMDGNTRVSAVGLGHNTNFLWSERDRCRIQRPQFFAPGQRKHATITMQRMGGKHRIDHVTNLLTMPTNVIGKRSQVVRFIFPIEGAVFTMSRDFLPSGTQVAMNVRSFDNQIIRGTEGRRRGKRTVAVLTLPAGAWYVECGFRAEGSQPALRTDGGEEYIAE